MTTQLARGAACVAPVADRSIDDLDLEICRLVRQMNAKTYRMLRLVRDFVWHGVLRRPYARRLYSPPPTGVMLYELMVGVFRRKG